MRFGDLINLFRTVDRLLRLETRHEAALAKLGGDIDDLRTRLIRLENREEIVVEKARGAASAAASQVAIASAADLARRIGRMEERTGQPRLDPPAA